MWRKCAKSGHTEFAAKINRRLLCKQTVGARWLISINLAPLVSIIHKSLEQIFPNSINLSLFSAIKQSNVVCVRERERENNDANICRVYREANANKQELEGRYVDGKKQMEINYLVKLTNLLWTNQIRTNIFPIAGHNLTNNWTHE